MGKSKIKNFGDNNNPVEEGELKNQPKKQILTKKELKKEPVDSGSIKSKESPNKTLKKIKESKNIEVKFECGWAPGGKSNICFLHTYENIEYKYELELNNKIYILDNKLKDEVKKRYREALRANGFQDITIIKSGAIFDKKKKEYIYKAYHPEHTENRPINGNIPLILIDDDGNFMTYKQGNKKGQQIIKQVVIKNGIVETDNQMVYEALLKAGFYSAGKTEKEDN
jgi:hypothetical protein